MTDDRWFAANGHAQGAGEGLLSGLLTALVEEVCRYVVLPGAAADLVALWIVHTHVADAAECTPYLNVTGPERRVGKTRLLEVLALLVRSPIETANISDAALFRVVASERPTLLFDEIDAVFSPTARNHEDLRGLLNAGYRRGAKVWRCVGERPVPEAFAVFCPKAFAGIGDNLPDTLADRSIPVRLKRKTKDETVERFRKREAEERASLLREQLERWAERNVDVLAAARPELPEELDDRAQDSWEPLLAIADLAGGLWPARARRAALELSAGEAREDDSLGVRLLADIRRVFEDRGSEKVSSKDLVVALGELEESHWASLRGRPLTERLLAKFLKPYGVRPASIWLADGRTPRGYKRDQFADPW